MTEPASQSVFTHPLADLAGPGFVATCPSSKLVWLSGGRVDLLANAARHGVTAVVVSKPGSRLTEPMRDALVSLGGRWVIDDADVMFDGLQGSMIASLAEVLQPPSDKPELASQFIHPPQCGNVNLVISWSQRHQAAAETVLGGWLEGFLSGLGFPPPAGWGTHEPVTEPWNRNALTEFARSRMPKPTRLVVAGGIETPIALTLTVQRTDHGVEELATGMVGLGAVDGAQVSDAIGKVPDVLAGLCDDTMPLFGLVMGQIGPVDLSRGPWVPGLPMPVAMLIGPPGVRALGIDVETARSRWGAIPAGRSRLPALVYPLIKRGTDGATALLEVVSGLDRAKLRTVMGRHTSQIAQGI